jgi:hypothetical protein
VKKGKLGKFGNFGDFDKSGDADKYSAELEFLLVDL